MNWDRPGKPPQGSAGSSAAHAHAPIGKTTLIQALPSVPASGRIDGDGAAAAAPGTVQHKAELHAADRSTSTPKQLAVHDIASLFGVPATAGGAPVQRTATS